MWFWRCGWHDGQQVIYEEVSGLAEAYRYVWGNGIDEALLRFGNGDIWYLDNQLGSVTALMNDAGQVIESYSYDVYGAVTAYDSSGQRIPVTNYDNRYLFTGREYNWRTGLYHYRARTYHPYLGHFLSRDPAEILLYDYVRCAPTVATDPTGLWWMRHEPLTKEPLRKVAEKVGLSDDARDLISRILVEANFSQDRDPTAFHQLYRHYNRSPDEPRLVALSRYLEYIATEISQWESHLEAGKCEEALKTLGRLLHTWQDFFSHAYHPQHGWDAWTAKPPAKGTPYQSDDLWPSSYPGEHPEVRWYWPFGFTREWGWWLDEEFQQRYEDAMAFTEKQLKRYLPEFLRRCRCWIEKRLEIEKKELEESLRRLSEMCPHIP